MSQTNQLETIKVDGVDRNVADLPAAIQQALTTYNVWRAQLVDAQDRAGQIHAAMQFLGAQIVEAIRKHDEEKTKEAEAVSTRVEGGVVDTDDSVDLTK